MEEEKDSFENVPHKKIKKNNMTTKVAQNLDKANKSKLDEKLKEVTSSLVEEEKSENISVNDKLKKQFEFYFGDANLRNDKFLKEKISKSEKGYIDLDVFLNFNKVKTLLQHIPDKKKQLKYLCEAINSSDLLKLNKSRTKVKRRLPFLDEVDKNTQLSIDKRTIYIEDFPEDIDHEAIAKIFSKCGKILYVSLPKYAESKAVKGFGFIEFSTEEEAKAAVDKYNNTVPSEFVEKSLFKGKINPLKVMPKMKWLELKEEFKKIKRELVQHLHGNQDSVSHQEQNKVSPEIPRGCLIKLKGIPTNNVDKTILKAAVSNFWPPKYVDYRKGSDECIIRFENKSLADSFIEKYKESGLIIQNQKVDIKSIQGQEEEAYLNKIKHYQNHLRRHHNETKGQKKPRRDPGDHGKSANIQNDNIEDENNS